MNSGEKKTVTALTGKGQSHWPEKDQAHHMQRQRSPLELRWGYNLPPTDHEMRLVHLKVESSCHTYCSQGQACSSVFK